MYYRIISKIDFKKEEIVCLCGSRKEFKEITIVECPCCEKLSYMCDDCQEVFLLNSRLKKRILENKQLLVLAKKIFN